jgi:hypothetical protein
VPVEDVQDVKGPILITTIAVGRRCVVTASGQFAYWLAGTLHELATMLTSIEETIR